MQNLCYISSSPARIKIGWFWDLSFVKPGITCLKAKKRLIISLLNFVSDNDECTQNTHTCSLTRGVCKNTPGSFRCSCKPGFIGDGHNCEGLSICYRHLSYKPRCYRRISSPEESRNNTREKISSFLRVFDIANQLLTRHSHFAPLGQVDERTAKPSPSCRQ